MSTTNDGPSLTMDVQYATVERLPRRLMPTDYRIRLVTDGNRSGEVYRATAPEGRENGGVFYPNKTIVIERSFTDSLGAPGWRAIASIASDGSLDANGGYSVAEVMRAIYVMLAVGIWPAHMVKP